MNTIPADRAQRKVLVQKAATHLDSIIPNWHNHVDLAQLNMQSCALCVLGQTFGSSVEKSIAEQLFPEEYTAAISTLEIPVGQRLHPVKRNHGYSIGKRFLEARLGDKFNFESAFYGDTDSCLWADEIASRRAAEPDEPADQSEPSNG